MKHNRRYLFMATAALTAFILTGATSVKANANVMIVKLQK